jgi:hypothetical protein
MITRWPRPANILTCQGFKRCRPQLRSVGPPADRVRWRGGDGRACQAIAGRGGIHGRPSIASRRTVILFRPFLPRWTRSRGSCTGVWCVVRWSVVRRCSAGSWRVAGRARPGWRWVARPGRARSAAHPAGGREHFQQQSGLALAGADAGLVGVAQADQHTLTEQVDQLVPGSRVDAGLAGGSGEVGLVDQAAQRIRDLGGPDRVGVHLPAPARSRSRCWQHNWCSSPANTCESYVWYRSCTTTRPVNSTSTDALNVSRSRSPSW